VAVLVRDQPVAAAQTVSVPAVLQRVVVVARSVAEMEVLRARVAAEEARAWVVAALAGAAAGAAVVIVAAEAGDKRT
jgi:hypothetical protein